MADYRIFYIGPDEHITGVKVVVCPNDLEAMTTARLAIRPKGVGEVWQNARKVGRVEAFEAARVLDDNHQEVISDRSAS